MPEILNRADKGNVSYLILNDLPANSLTMQMMKYIQEELKSIDNDKNIRVVVVESASNKIFCSGHNLKEVKSMIKEDDLNAQKTLFAECSNMMKSLQSLSKPVIAKVNGIATAAGTQLVASCDLAYGSLESTYATPGVNIGLFCHTPSVAVSRMIGKKPMMEMLFTGAPIDAEKAKNIGLINDAVDQQKLDQKISEVCSGICQKSSEVVAMGKKSFYRQSEMPLSEAYDFTSAQMVKNLTLNDANEGISAFIEKRDPEWQDS